MKRIPHRPQQRSRTLAVLCSIAAATIGLAAGAIAAPASADGRPPAGARKAEAVRDLKSAIAQTAAVVEGRVVDIQHEFSEAEGPWTRVTLADVKAHMGSSPSTVEIRHFGGPLPNGKMMIATELPAFVQGGRYVVFLRNTAWNLSPVVGELALRAERVEGREVLVNSDGLAVTGVGKQGVEFGEALFDALPLDGSAPKLMEGRKLAQMARQPLERSRFVRALGDAVAMQGLAVAGPFYRMPAGEFRWRANATAAKPGVLPTVTPAQAAAQAAPEVDTTRPN